MLCKYLKRLLYQIRALSALLRLVFSGNVIISEDDLDQALIDIAHNYERGIMRRHLTGGYQHLLEFWDEAENSTAI